LGFPLDLGLEGIFCWEAEIFGPRVGWGTESVPVRRAGGLEIHVPPELGVRGPASPGIADFLGRNRGDFAEGGGVVVGELLGCGAPGPSIGFLPRILAQSRSLLSIA
jgi:hypothetical protein